jgi:hypothetical protein
VAPPKPSPEPVVVVVVAPSPKPELVVAETPPARAEVKPILVEKTPTVPRTKTVAGAILTAVGIGALGGSLAGALVGADAGDQIHSMTSKMQTYDPSVQSRGLAANSAAIAMLVVGGVARVSGVVALAVGARDARPGNRRASAR